MIESAVWAAKREKRPVIHQRRKRRARFGELVQIGGSPHAWFENSRPLAYYSDKHGIFRINKPGVHRNHLTQFGRALKELETQLIY